VSLSRRADASQMDTLGSAARVAGVKVRATTQITRL
jgi:hypothetical protein